MSNSTVFIFAPVKQRVCQPDFEHFLPGCAVFSLAKPAEEQSEGGEIFPVFGLVEGNALRDGTKKCGAKRRSGPRDS
jgi:hypothetical protein